MKTKSGHLAEDHDDVFDLVLCSGTPLARRKIFAREILPRLSRYLENLWPVCVAVQNF